MECAGGNGGGGGISNAMYKGAHLWHIWSASDQQHPGPTCPLQAGQCIRREPGVRLHPHPHMHFDRLRFGEDSGVGGMTTSARVIHLLPHGSQNPSLNCPGVGEEDGEVAFGDGVAGGESSVRSPSKASQRSSFVFFL